MFSFALRVIYLGIIFSKSVSKKVSLTLRVQLIDASPDGFKRKILSFNGKYPAPAIRTNVGDFLEVKVFNDLVYDGSAPFNHFTTSVHWHGLLQRGTNGMDGAVGVTQHAILPGQSFVYTFTTTDSGTYWYHSHSNLQYVDGLRGPLIVHDPLEDAQYSDAIVAIADWYHSPSYNIFRDIYMQSNIAIPFGGLINGFGQNRSDCELSRTQSKCPDCCRRVQIPIASASSKTARCHPLLSAGSGSSGKPTRIRIISMSAEASFVFSVDNHVLWITALDGIALPALPANRMRSVRAVRVSPGQRVDAVVCRAVSVGTTATVKMRARMVVGFLVGAPDVDSVFAEMSYGAVPPNGLNIYSLESASGFYHSSVISTSTQISDRTIGHMDTSLSDVLETEQLQREVSTGLNISDSNVAHKRVDIRNTIVAPSSDAPGYTKPVDNSKLQSVTSETRSVIPAPTKTIKVDMNFHFDSSAGFVRGIMNDQSMNDIEAVPGPTLLDQFKSGTLPRSSPLTAIARVNVRDVVRVVVNNLDPFMHPMHLHGHRIIVLARGAAGQGVYDAKTVTLATEPTVIRDTEVVYGNSFLVFQLEDLNPGVWIMHCHIAWHLMLGLGMILVVDGDGSASNVREDETPSKSSLLRGSPAEPPMRGHMTVSVVDHTIKTNL